MIKKIISLIAIILLYFSIGSADTKITIDGEDLEQRIQRIQEELDEVKQNIESLDSRVTDLEQSSETPDPLVTYIVDINGTGDFLSVQDCIDTLSGPGNCLVKPGVYEQFVTLGPEHSGNEIDGYLTIDKFGETRPIFDGINLVGWRGIVQANGASYIRIKGLEITKYKSSGIRVDTGNASHIEIEDNFVHDNYQAQGTRNAIVVKAGWPIDNTYSLITDVVIKKNIIKNVTTGPPSGGYNEALTLSGDVKRAIIEENIIDNAFTIGIDLAGGYKNDNAYPQYVYIRRNEVLNSGSEGSTTAIYLDGAKDVVIEENKVHHNTGHAIVTSNESNIPKTERIIVRRNLSWDNNPRNLSPGDPGGSDHITGSTRVVHNTLVHRIPGRTNIFLYKNDDLILKNNISYNIGPDNPSRHVANGLTETLAYFNFNCYNRNLGTGGFQYQGQFYYNFDLWKNGTGFDINSILADPVFVDLDNADFRLQSTSPCVDVGQALTFTIGAGNGNILIVDDPFYFSDGRDIEGVLGDRIFVNGQEAVITHINYDTKTITLDRNLNWLDGASVTYPYVGIGPDMGAFELGT